MELFERLRSYLAEERPVALATVVAGPNLIGRKMLVHANGSTEGQLDTARLDHLVALDSVQLLHAEISDTRSYELPKGTYDVFIDVYPAPPKLVIVGGVQIGQALCHLAKALGYRVIVTDARAAFAAPERFPEADEVIKGWPQDVLPRIRFDESTYVVLLSHDPKFDEPTLQYVLPQPVRYIGAIGSRRTQEQRRERLRAQGFDDATLQKLYGPVGLDLGARSAEETALAILAEITAVRYGRAGGMMSHSREAQPVG